MKEPTNQDATDHPPSSSSTSEDRRPPYVVKSYRDKEDRYGVEVGAGWKVGQGGIAITIREGLAVSGRIVAWPRKDS
jgi:hypothetical protein